MVVEASSYAACSIRQRRHGYWCSEGVKLCGEREKTT
jgi:hypothetical protein